MTCAELATGRVRTGSHPVRARPDADKDHFNPVPTETGTGPIAGKEGAQVSLASNGGGRRSSQPRPTRCGRERDPRLFPKSSVHGGPDFDDKDTPEHSPWRQSADRYSRPIGRLSQRGRTEWRIFPLATITFLGQRTAITGPEALLLAGRVDAECQCSVRRQPLDDLLPGPPTPSPAGPSPNPWSTPVAAGCEILTKEGNTGHRDLGAKAFGREPRR